MIRLVATAVAIFSLVLSGCGTSPDCKGSCDKLRSCGLGTSGISCDSKCKVEQEECSVCIQDTACAEVRATCGPKCPGVVF